MQNRKTVLFVDDDPTFLEMLQAILGHYAGENWHIDIASSASAALQILHEKKVDLLVIDLHMPVVDGLQFLSLLQRKYPETTKVILTGFASDQYRAECLNNGAELFLEKPATSEAWAAIYQTLDQVVKIKPEDGFRGVLRQVGLQDVLQLSCLARQSVVLEVTAGTLQGEIFVKDGEIIHAQCGERTGENAFNFLLGLSGGEFNLKPFADPATRSLDQQWEFLLMEAARMRDEVHEEAPEATGQTEYMLAQVAETQSSHLEQIAAAASVSHERPSPSTAEPARATAISPTPAFVAPPAVQPKPPATSNNPEPRVDELLICSVDGDVLHQWQCQNTANRINFLEFLCQKAGLLQRTLPLGDFDRVEVNGTNARVVAQLLPERALFLRSSRVAEKVSL